MGSCGFKQETDEEESFNMFQVQDLWSLKDVIKYAVNEFDAILSRGITPYLFDRTNEVEEINVKMCFLGSGK
jgi:hypothetical protein